MIKKGTDTPTTKPSLHASWTMGFLFLLSFTTHVQLSYLQKTPCIYAHWAGPSALAPSIQAQK
jgi:hypothetical protein